VLSSKDLTTLKKHKNTLFCSSHLGFGIVNANRELVRGEATEDHRVDGACCYIVVVVVTGKG
jgi:hypothetical protein